MKWPGKKNSYGKSSTKSEAPQIEESKMPSNQIERTKRNAILHSTQVTWHAKSTSAKYAGRMQNSISQEQIVWQLTQFQYEISLVIVRTDIYVESCWVRLNSSERSIC